MLVAIKGAGDIATGVACRLKNSGFKVYMLEIEVPTTVRRTVAFSRCIYEEKVEIEGIDGCLAKDIVEVEKILENGKIPVLIDKEGLSIKKLKPDVVVDAIIAKKNIGTKIDDANIVIGLGPGFIAEKDCHVVIETNRGHNLGRCIYKGEAERDTGIPGNIGGYTKERIIRGTNNGKFNPIKNIGEQIKAGDVVASIDGVEVRGEITGLIRGLLQKDVYVTKGMKVGDVDPRGKYENCFSISDKARSIGGGVLEAILYLKMKGRKNE